MPAASVHRQNLQVPRFDKVSRHLSRATVAPVSRFYPVDLREPRQAPFLVRSFALKHRANCRENLGLSADVLVLEETQILSVRHKPLFFCYVL